MKEKILYRFLLLLLAFVSGMASAQVSINGSGTVSPPDPSAILDLKTARGKGLLLPRVSNTASVAQPWTAGMMVFSVADDCVMYYNGSNWVSLCQCDIPTPDQPGLITISPTTINLNSTTEASIAAVVRATSYVWTLPAGLSGSSTGTNITITGTVAGSYTISVKAVNDCGSSADRVSTTALTVNNCTGAPAQPDAISLSTTSVNQNSTFTASIAAVSGATSYEWTVPSGMTITGVATGISITITAITTGSIAASGITVTARNDCGLSSARAGTGTITVNAACPGYLQPGSNLCWYKTDEAGDDIPWWNAQNCNTAKTGSGTTGWRLPTSYELSNISPVYNMLSGQPQSATGTQDLLSDNYWSNQNYPTDAQFAVQWYFQYGYSGNMNKDYAYGHARCVKPM